MDFINEYIPSINFKSGKVYISQNQTIPPNSEIVVEAYSAPSTPIGSCYLIEEDKDVVEKYGAIPARCLVVTSKKNTFPLRIFNIESNPVTLKRGCSIANYSTMQKSDILDGRQDIQLRHMKSDMSMGKNLEHRKQELFMKYQDLFEGIDKCNTYHHKIDTGNAEPIKIPPRRINSNMKIIAAEQIK